MSKVKYYDPLVERFKEKCRQRHRTIDYQYLRKYDQWNKHFSIEAVSINEEEQERLIGYDCIYRYGTHEIKLEYNIPTEMWTIVSDKYDAEEEKQLNTYIDRINKFSWVDMGYALDDRIQQILRSFDLYFLKRNQAKEAKQNKEKMSETSSVFKKENISKCVDNQLTGLSSNKVSTSETIFEDDERQSEENSNSSEKDLVDYDLHTLITDFCPKFSDLASPPVVARRSRQKRACRTQSSVRNTSFISPPTAPIRRRRAIESILLHVQQKKKTFEKLVDVLKGIETPTMHDLGSEFLRAYNGKFNYREGHTFVMHFRRKSWFLTIKQIKCVDCPIGDIGPQSVLTLSYKGQYTSVHV